MVTIGATRLSIVPPPPRFHEDCTSHVCVCVCVFPPQKRPNCTKNYKVTFSLKNQNLKKRRGQKSQWGNMVRQVTTNSASNATYRTYAVANTLSSNCNMDRINKKPNDILHLCIV